MAAPGAYRIRMALCRPSGSSHTVFQNTPGRRSTHGTSAVVTKRLLTASLISLAPHGVGAIPALAPGGFQSLAHHLAERLHRMRAHQSPAVDEEGRRPGNPDRAALA